MRSGIPSRSTLGLESSRTASALDLLARARFGMRLALAAALLLCPGSERLFASSNELPANAVPGLTVRRSMRAAPHRLIVHPSDVTVAANQSQRFAVTDAQGKPVSVHWNVSGIGCSGEACGTIDEHGIYQPPRSLPRPRIVTVEGVLASDPNYSVLTEVRLADAVAPAPVEAAAAQKPQDLAAPVIDSGIEKQNVARAAALPPLPKAIASAPVVESRNVESRNNVRSGQAPPLPNVISAPPVIGSQNASRSNASRSNQQLPLPHAIASAPAVESRQVARTGELPPLPGAVTATPSVEKTNVSSRGATLALPVVVGAAPTIEKNNLSNRGEVPQLPKAVSAAPAIKKADVARHIELPPVPKAEAAAPVAKSQTIARAAELPPPAESAVTNRNVAQKMEVQPMTSMLVIVPDTGKKTGRNAPSPKTEIAFSESKPSSTASSTKSATPDSLASARPPAAPVYSEKPQRLLSAAPERKPSTPRALLPQMQDATSAASIVAAPPAATPGAQQHASVTYSNGQLKIDAENLTLAAVLKLVAEKTGAVIEVPPGTGTERIFDHIGPGRPEDVLASLLNGSAFDFVIVGSPQGMQVPTQVLLTLRGTESPAPPPTLVASDQGTSEPKADAYLWTPSSSPAVSPSTVWVPPAATTAPPATSSAAQPSSSSTPPEPLSPDAKEQMMRNFTRQLHGLPPQADTAPQQ
jgi:hypothetical protein